MSFLDECETINANNYNYGNDVLYSGFSFSKNILPVPGTTPDTKFSSAISVIGNAYSANPTRSAAKDTFFNAGIGTSFDLIVAEILKDPNYEEFFKKIKELSSKRYEYNPTDREILETTLTCVDLLNSLLQKAMTNIAKSKGLLKDADKCISFCSKFVHFMCPHTVFIYDSFSNKGSSGLMSAHARGEKSIGKCVIDKDFRAEFRKNWRDKYTDIKIPNINEYCNHVRRAYALAKYLNRQGIVPTPQISGDPTSTYMPRLVDSILMNIT